jgi:hypothetical protein
MTIDRSKTAGIECNLGLAFKELLILTVRLGEIAPEDPAAREQWNGKAVQYGGGDFNGVLITGLDPQVPLARGYATWGTDSGHDHAKLAQIQAFAINAEALESICLRVPQEGAGHGGCDCAYTLSVGAALHLLLWRAGIRARSHYH